MLVTLKVAYIVTYIGYTQGSFIKVDYICSTQKSTTGTQINYVNEMQLANLLPISITKVCVCIYILSRGKYHVPFVNWLISASTITPCTSRW